MKDPKSILETILKKNVDQAEVYLSASKATQIDVLNQKVDAIKEVGDEGLGIRIIKNKKLGFAYTSEFDESVLEETINRAIENAKNSEPDQFNSLPLHLPISPSPHLDLFDPKIPQTPIKKRSN